MGHSTQEHLALACDLTVIACMDFRLWNGTLERELHFVYGESATFDLLTPPGACHRLVRETGELREQLLDDLGMSVSLHQHETVAIVQHTDCGRYSYMAFESEEIERVTLAQDIHAAARVIRRRYPNVTVEGFIAILRNNRVVCLESIGIVGSAKAVPSRRNQARA